MAQYSYADIMKMQNDAARRVEEMQKRARSVSGLDEAPAMVIQGDAETLNGFPSSSWSRLTLIS